MSGLSHEDLLALQGGAAITPEDLSESTPTIPREIVERYVARAAESSTPKVPEQALLRRLLEVFGGPSYKLRFGGQVCSSADENLPKHAADYLKLLDSILTVGDFTGYTRVASAMSALVDKAIDMTPPFDHRWLLRANIVITEYEYRKAEQVAQLAGNPVAVAAVIRSKQSEDTSSDLDSEVDWYVTYRRAELEAAAEELRNGG